MAGGDEIPLLDDALLGELEQRWRSQGAFIAGALRPGLNDEQMNELVAPLGLHLPREARRWWGWHDGARPQGRSAAAELGPTHEFLPLAKAVAKCAMIREIVLPLRDSENDYSWKWSWLPIDRAKAPMVIDCSVADEDPVPARSFFFEDPDAGAEGARSMGELVTIWIEAIDCGAWRYNRQEDHWEYDWQKLDPDMELRGLA